VPFCSQCGERLGSDDVFCGSCGAPADDGRPTQQLALRAVESPGSQRPAADVDADRSPQLVPSRSRWVWVATLAVLILAAGGIAATFLLTNHPASSAAAATSPSASPTGRAGGSSSSATPESAASVTVTATPSASATPASALSHDSPAAPFWAAFFFASYSWDSAQTQAQEARDRGFTDVLVLLTTEYANLGRPGETIWSCCVGPLDTRGEALKSRSDLRAAGWTDAYVKQAQ
jgi:hypothetical protein